jgi:hypothetical protein
VHNLSGIGADKPIDDYYYYYYPEWSSKVRKEVDLIIP